MPYLVAFALPHYPTTDTPDDAQVVCKRLPLAKFDMDHIEAALRQRYPEADILNPFERREGGTVLMVYMSGNKEGRGRIARQFQLWKVC
jgi:hypothetical protein